MDLLIFNDFKTLFRRVGSLISILVVFVSIPVSTNGNPYRLVILGESGTSIFINNNPFGHIPPNGKIEIPVESNIVQIRAEKRGYVASERTVRITGYEETITVSLISAGIFAINSALVFSFLALLVLLLGFIVVFKSGRNNESLRDLSPAQQKRYQSSDIPGPTAGSGYSYGFTGNFDYTDIIGRGGMSVVYKAKDRITGKLFAIKVLEKEYATDEDLVKKFFNEAYAIEKLNEKFPKAPVIKIMGFNRDMNGNPYIAMNLLNGAPLHSYLKSNYKFNINLSLRIIREVLVGLDCAHSLGIIHRDISPDNIILDKISRDFRVTLIDFGVAKLKSSLMKTKGDLYGKPCYMAPEQIDGVSTFKSDIYSLGVVFYHLVASYPPFDDYNPMIVLNKHKYEPVPKLPDNIPYDIQKLIYSMMNKSIDERPDSARYLIRQINYLLNNKGF